MTRTCTICNHDDVEEINKQLLSGTAYRDIAGQFQISKSALERHKENHISDSLLKSQDVKDIVMADNLFEAVQNEASVVRELRDQARSEGNIELALKAVDRALKCINLCGKLQGQIKDQNDPKPFHVRLRWYDELKDETKYDS